MYKRRIDLYWYFKCHSFLTVNIHKVENVLILTEILAHTKLERTAHRFDVKTIAVLFFPVLSFSSSFRYGIHVVSLQALHGYLHKFRMKK